MGRRLGQEGGGRRRRCYCRITRNSGSQQGFVYTCFPLSREMTSPRCLPKSCHGVFSLSTILHLGALPAFFFFFLALYFHLFSYLPCPYAPCTLSYPKHSYLVRRVVLMQRVMSLSFMSSLLLLLTRTLAEEIFALGGGSSWLLLWHWEPQHRLLRLVLRVHGIFVVLSAMRDEKFGLYGKR